MLAGSPSLVIPAIFARYKSSSPRWQKGLPSRRPWCGRWEWSWFANLPRRGH